jgi:inner membrane transporter RhtA
MDVALSSPGPLGARVSARTATLRELGGAAPAPLLLLGAMVSLQVGSAVATSLFGQVGVGGTVFLRALMAALVLLALTRPTLRGRSRRDLLLVLLFGAILAGLNGCFYLAIDRVPLGVAATVEFLGPLGVALAMTRRRLDLLWVVAAGAGVGLFAWAPDSLSLDGLGLLFAAGGACCWAAYVLVAQRVGGAWSGSHGLALALAAAAVLTSPFALAGGGGELLEPRVLAVALVVGVLSAAVPFSLEMAALRRLAARTYGVLISLEPAIASLVGLVVLQQTPRVTEAAAALLVVTASIGATRTAAGP